MKLPLFFVFLSASKGDVFVLANIKIISQTADFNQQNVHSLNNYTSNNLQDYMGSGLIDPRLIPHTGYGKVIITFAKGEAIDIRQEISIKPSDIIKNYRKPVK